MNGTKFVHGFSGEMPSEPGIFGGRGRVIMCDNLVVFDDQAEMACHFIAGVESDLNGLPFSCVLVKPEFFEFLDREQYWRRAEFDEKCAEWIELKHEEAFAVP